MFDNNLNELNSTQDVGYVTVKKNRVKSKMLIGLGMIIIILIGLATHFFISKNNPKNVFINISNYLFNNVENYLNKFDFNIEETSLINGSVGVDTTFEEFSFLNDLQFDYNLGIDFKNKKSELGVGLIKNNEEVLKAEAEIKNNNVYITLKNIYDKVILIDKNYIKENAGTSIEEMFEEIEDIYFSEDRNKDTIYIVKEMKKITTKVLKKINYEKETEVININGEELKTNKMILPINDENLQIITNVYITEILNNEKLLEKLASYINQDKDYIKEKLETAKEEIEEIEVEEESKIAIYTYGLFGKIVKISVEYENGNYNSYTKYNNYISFDSGDVITEIIDDKLTMKEFGELILTGKVNSLEKNIIDIEYEYFNENKTLATGNIKFINNKELINLEFNFNSEVNEGIKINLEYKYEKNNKDKYSYNFNLLFGYENEEIDINTYAELLINEDIANNDVSNAIKIEELTQNDMNDIYNNFESKLGIIGVKKSNNLNMFVEAEKNAFAIEANQAIDAASQAISLISIGTITIDELGNSTDYSMKETYEGIEYCFTIKKLTDLGLLKYTENEIPYGTVVVTRNNDSNHYSYNIKMHNGNYYVNDVKNNVEESDVFIYSASTSNIYGDDVLTPIDPPIKISCNS